MSARPGRIVAEIAIDEPHPRTDAFRVSSASPAGARNCPNGSLRPVTTDRRTPGCRMNGRGLGVCAPAAVGAAFVLAWEGLVKAFDVPFYLVPSPVLVLNTLVRDAPLLFASLLVTLKITALALLLAVVLGVSVAFLFVQNRMVERSLFPYVVVLQVTAIVAIAPLIIIWVKDPLAALVICAAIVAIFPVISNTSLGLRSVDPGLADLFRLWGRPLADAGAPAHPQRFAILLRRA
jgi:NitT/TauT family transport system permease protein